MDWWLHLRTLRTRLMVPVISSLLGVAAIAGAVVMKPDHSPKSDLLANLRQRIEEHAQVDLFDDFSQGLDAWQGGENAVSTWSYDSSGFVNPGSLLIFEPTRRLSDYDLDALVQIQEKAVGFAFRAISAQSYEVAKLMIEGSGPMNSLAIQRYAVIAGQPSRPVVTRYPLKFQAGTFYQVHLEVRDDRFLLYVQGRLVDYWSDTQLPVGGVGLFCSKGEHARAVWIRISHNADFEGRVCSWLSTMLTAK